jgi:hypothetical protein
MEDALKRLDKLTQEEVGMAVAQNLKATHVVDERVRGVADDVDQVKRSSSPNLISIDYRASRIISENQLRENIHKWLSPPDPSTNHNIACDTQHKKIATWFFQGSMFREWKSTGSLLWIHGKRAQCPTSHPIPSDDISKCSWLRQEHSLVGERLALSIPAD